MRRHVFSAYSISLNARPRKVGRDTQLRVRVVRWRTVANVDSIRRSQMLPIVGREVIESKQAFAILL